MEIHERIRYLRKHELRLSETEFGKELGVSRSVINNIERNLLLRPERKQPLFQLIIAKFHVNEDWLYNGTGPIFTEPEKAKPEMFNLDEYLSDKGADETELALMKAYFNLPKTVRKYLMYYLRKELASEDQKEEPSPTEQAEQNYIKKISNSAPNEESSASNTTEEKGNYKKAT